jgi:type IV pilus modification protein PilV
LLITKHGIVAKISGFSLLEVLIASLVFSFGLAGFASLLLASISGASMARADGAAALAASSLAEQLRMNPAAVQRYLAPPELVAGICNGVTVCSPEQQADYDFRLWQIELANSIRGARGLVCHDGTPQDGGEGDARCDGAGPLVIKVFWPGLRNPTGGESQQHRYVLEVS